MRKDRRATRNSFHPTNGHAAAWLLLVGFAIAFLGLSCGSGSATNPQVAVTLAADPVPLPGVQIHLGPSSAGPELELLLVVGGPERFYRTRYDFSYPTDLIRVDSVTEGQFLSENGDVDTRFDVQRRPGVVSVEHTRVGDVGSLTQPGRYTTMATIRLTVLRSGSGRVSFSAHQVFDENGDPVPGYTWGSAGIESEL
jgi:hypothetical protein